MISYFYENKYLSFIDNYINYINCEEIQNIETFLDLPENDFIQERLNPYNSSYFIDSKYCYSVSKYNTNCETLNKNINYSQNNEFYKEDESICSFISFQEIKNIFNKHKFTELYDNFIKNHIIEVAEYKLYNKKRKSNIIEDAKYTFCNKKRERENESFIFFKKEEAGDKIKRGRKAKLNKENYRAEHNKNSEDNIIKKIKAKLLLYPLLFLNNILKSSDIDKRLYKLDYKYTNQLKKDEDMNIIKMSLKELYSLDISPKFTKNLPNDINKKNIKEIIENNNIKDYETIMFVFNLSFADWMELFCYKKDINEIINKYEGIYNVDKDIIKNNFVGVENLLRMILKKVDKHDFSAFTFFLYNYTRWFYIKNGRNKEDNNV